MDKFNKNEALGTVTIAIGILTIVLFSTCDKSDYLNEKVQAEAFNKEVWARNTDMNNKDNPRLGMTQDIINNYLKVDMTRSEIIEILGFPYEESIKFRLPKDIKLPDSLIVNNITSKNELKLINQVNKFYDLHAKKDTLMIYNIGWSTIDPKFLIIKLNGNGRAKNFMFE